MLTQVKYRIPEIFLGMLLAIAIFVLGASFFHGQPNNRPPDEQTSYAAQQEPAPMAYWHILGVTISSADLLAMLLVGATMGLGGVTAWGIYSQRRETKILQRAYLTVEPLGINPFISKTGRRDNRMVGHINIVNVGRMPAKVSISQKEPRLRVTSKILLEDDLKSEKGAQVAVLAPGGKMIVGTKNISNRSLDTDRLIYVWGRVDYLDGFDRWRVTRFCHRYPCRAHELAADGSKSIEGKYARYHEYGNSAD